MGGGVGWFSNANAKFEADLKTLPSSPKWPDEYSNPNDEVNLTMCMDRRNAFAFYFMPQFNPARMLPKKKWDFFQDQFRKEIETWRELQDNFYEYWFNDKKRKLDYSDWDNCQIEAL